LRDFKDGRLGNESSVMVGFVTRVQRWSVSFLYEVSMTVGFIPLFLYEISKTVGFVLLRDFNDGCFFSVTSFQRWSAFDGRFCTFVFPQDFKYGRFYFIKRFQ